MMTIDRYKYGAVEINGLVDNKAYFAVDRSLTVRLDDKRLSRITRLRLLSEPGYPLWDLSYCHGVLKDGTHVKVQLPRWQFKRGPGGLNGDLIAMCREAGVHGKSLGIFDAISTVS